MLKLKLQYFGHLMRLIRKDLDAGRDWGQEEKGITEDRMAVWHHWLNGHEFEQIPGDGEGQGSLALQSMRLQRVRHNLANWTATIVTLLGSKCTGDQDKWASFLNSPVTLFVHSLKVNQNSTYLFNCLLTIFHSHWNLWFQKIAPLSVLFTTITPEESTFIHS